MNNNKRKFQVEEKLQILREGENHGVELTCRKYQILRSMFYNWTTQNGEFVKGDDIIEKIKNASSLVLPLTNSERELSLLNQNNNENVLNFYKIQSIEKQAGQ
ncbi:MAG: putative transposase [Eubacteriaceae bacterium]|jgi:transposase-like protein|nr:putative transposase [Eubacteriaceae bacterium]